MAKNRAGNTALGAATCRLIEQYQPEETRLFEDPLVQALVGAPIRVLMRLPVMRRFTIQQTDAMTTGIFGAQLCRTRYIDDAVRLALAEGIDQLVILGAGFDTRGYRLPGIERVRVFEVDLPEVQHEKKQRLQKYLGRLPENVAYLPVDFTTQTLEAAMQGSAFDPTRPAVFVWEGVTQYLTEGSVRQTLAYVGQCAPRSRLFFTYVLKSIIERRSGIQGMEKLLDFVAKNNAPWRFGLDPQEVPAYLRSFHLEVIADVGNAQYQQQYLEPIRRSLTVSEGERIVLAQVVRS